MGDERDVFRGDACIQVSPNDARRGANLAEVAVGLEPGHADRGHGAIRRRDSRSRVRRSEESAEQCGPIVVDRCTTRLSPGRELAKTSQGTRGRRIRELPNVSMRRDHVRRRTCDERADDRALHCSQQRQVLEDEDVEPIENTGVHLEQLDSLGEHAGFRSAIVGPLDRETAPCLRQHACSVAHIGRLVEETPKRRRGGAVSLEEVDRGCRFRSEAANGRGAAKSAAGRRADLALDEQLIDDAAHAGGLLGVSPARELGREAAEGNDVEPEDRVAAGQQVRDCPALGRRGRDYIKDVAGVGVSPGAQGVEGTCAVVGVERAGEEKAVLRIGHSWLSGEVSRTGRHTNTRT